jgi:hypothetical protein
MVRSHTTITVQTTTNAEPPRTEPPFFAELAHCRDMVQMMKVVDRLLPRWRQVDRWNLVFRAWVWRLTLEDRHRRVGP